MSANSTAPAGPGDEVVTKLSPWSVGDTVARLRAVIASRGMKLFAVIDHSGEAAGCGLRETKIVFFGSLPARHGRASIGPFPHRSSDRRETGPPGPG